MSNKKNTIFPKCYLAVYLDQHQWSSAFVGRLDLSIEWNRQIEQKQGICQESEAPAISRLFKTI